MYVGMMQSHDTYSCSTDLESDLVKMSLPERQVGL